MKYKTTTINTVKEQQIKILYIFLENYGIM